MGRPSKTGPSIVVDIDGELLVWTDGALSCSNREYAKAAKRASFLSLPIDITFHGPQVKAELDNPKNPAGAAAAMIAVNPGRALILFAPDEVMNLIPYDDVDDSTLAWVEKMNNETVEA